MIFLYFFPGKTHVTVNDVKASFAVTALRDVLESERRFQHDCVQNHLIHTGPEGQTGTLLTCHPNGAELPGFVPCYDKERQEWRNINGVWLGWFRDMRPMAENMQRRLFLEGAAVELGDGRSWTIPTIRRADGLNRLPHAWGCDATGAMTRRLLTQYRSIWDMACEMWQVFTNGKETTYGEAWKWCVDSLSINYRIGPHEIDALQLLTDENHLSVLKGVVDWFTVEDMIEETRKKKEEQPSQQLAS